MATALVTGGSNGILQAESAAAPEALNAPLSLLNQSVTPAAVTGAAALYGAAGQPAWINPQGLTGSLVGSQGGLQTAGTAITTTTSETVLMTMSLPASDAAAGSVYKQVGFGVFATTGSPGNTVFTARLGGVAGTSLIATANITLGTSLSTGSTWKIESVLNFLTATTAECVMEIMVNSAAAGAASTYLAANTSATTVSLSTAKTWVVTITPGASGNSITLLGSYSERLS